MVSQLARVMAGGFHCAWIVALVMIISAFAVQLFG